MRYSLVSDLTRELASVLRGYPAFVLSPHAAPPAAHVPVFVYHSIEPRAFERDLAFLADNRYRTIGMAELVRHLRGGGAAPRSVVLTFDDARSSFWRYGYPLLERYGMRGVLFVIAGLTLDAPSCRPNLSAVRDGACTPADIEALDPDDVTLCTWPELAHMQASGVVEVESHSLFHREVFVGTEIVGFIAPDTPLVPYATPATAYLDHEDVGRPLARERLLGLPLFRAAPLYAAPRAFRVPPDLRRFARGLWDGLSDRERSPSACRRVLRERWRRVDAAARLERWTETEIAAAIAEDLALARELIKTRVGATAGAHFCVPYGSAGAATLAAAARLGIESVCWGVIPGKKHNAPGDSPFEVARLKCDFLRRLPAANRASLAAIYGHKALRRLRGERVY
ncbi:MAG TPA: polysaccharide deacetylase family protein [Gammaproteobacteria bacterium]